MIAQAHNLAPWNGTILATYTQIAAAAGACEEARILKQRTILVWQGSGRESLEEKLDPMLTACEQSE